MSSEGPISSAVYRFKNPAAIFPPATGLEPNSLRSYWIVSDPVAKKSTAPRTPRIKGCHFAGYQVQVTDSKVYAKRSRKKSTGDDLKNGGLPICKILALPRGTALLLLPYPDAPSLDNNTPILL